MRILAWLGRHATAALALGVFVGLLIPPLAELLRGGLTVLVFLFTAVSLLKIDGATFAPVRSRPGLPCAIIVWCLVVVPLLAGGALRLLALPEGLSQAIVIWASSPPMTAAIVFAVLLGLDVPLATGVALISIFVVPLIGPALCLMLAGLPIGIDAPVLIARVGVFIGLAAGAAYVVRRLAGGERLQRHADALNGLIIVTLIAYAAALTAGLGDAFAARPGRILAFVAAGFVSNVAVQIVTAFAFLKFGATRSATAAMLAGNRNMSILCAGLGAAITPDIMLFFAVSHVAVYTLPWLLRGLYDRIGERAKSAIAGEKMLPRSA
ncbi:hypothetical protein JQ557_07495 [Bradyrhizobium sp. U87765 SZCCT0131]|uniref:hypothetical protein n=1 Tax=unclassified Bradyrhizobium TaxID=2631580 RepID=UPI001BAC19B7|nr:MULTISPECIES: hypothetical protein [unclassified Bradyrhizobium]MBR1217827.1 hypothetical protein [Bradyrhizobium sp. U87765 SZCCT0131]MBR1261227.1 hypothetical protein [Bradyrhizobium sp. U87765 SZCCT0134]MBR1303325.1 hypothetical protein [Bradyrhizobium sp. U87765 SZCCT0110]MBR1318931.1 hypothetical protein [Bradyrhizobium sp. U87765 SZCCT0109]MBR1347256.1 hypothetical protein [Bradyrhizobium sp. U87765 SZCCT0048]